MMKGSCIVLINPQLRNTARYNDSATGCSCSIHKLLPAWLASGLAKYPLHILFVLATLYIQRRPFHIRYALKITAAGMYLILLGKQAISVTGSKMSGIYTCHDNAFLVA